MNLIVACDKNYGIGYNNKLPDWKIKDDLKKFKTLTTDSIVIMGRKTFESLPNGPLKNRINIIISINSFDELYNKYKDNDNIFVFTPLVIYNAVHYKQSITSLDI